MNEKQNGRCSVWSLTWLALPEGGATVGASPLAQSEAEEDADGEEEDGTQDAQAGEVVLQHPNPAGRTAPYHHH